MEGRIREGEGKAGLGHGVDGSFVGCLSGVCLGARGLFSIIVVLSRCRLSGFAWLVKEWVLLRLIELVTTADDDDFLPPFLFL